MIDKLLSPYRKSYDDYDGRMVYRRCAPGDIYGFYIESFKNNWYSYDENGNAHIFNSCEEAMKHRDGVLIKLGYILIDTEEQFAKYQMLV